MRIKNPIGILNVNLDSSTIEQNRSNILRLFNADDEHDGWYRITNKDDEAEIFIYGEIGYYGVTANSLIRDLGELGKVKNLTVRINSYGGEVFEALAILNYLRDLKSTITVKIDGVAASAASFLAMCGDKVIAMPNSKMMIHNARGVAYGQASDLRVMADLLDDTSTMIADIYTDRCGGKREDWLKAMDEETWYTSEEALECGLVDEVADVRKSSENVAKRRISDERVASLGNILRIAALHTPQVKTSEEVIDDDLFNFSGFDFKAAMGAAAEEFDDIPWDSEGFKGIMKAVRDDAPEPTVIPEVKKEQEDSDPIIDFSMIDAAVRAAVQKG